MGELTVKDVFVCDAVRTAVGAYGKSLAKVRCDDLAAVPIVNLLKRNPGLDPQGVSDVVVGCANQAGEDNRNVARMALLLAGLPHTVPGVTVNRLCGSGLDAIGYGARAIACGEAELVLAGGVESMSRAPFVLSKAEDAFSRSAEIYDTTIGWRFINQKMQERYGTDSMIQTADNVARELNISREDQDRFALWSQEKAAAAQADGRLAREIVPVLVPQKKKEPLVVDRDEHLRQTSLDKLSSLKAINGSEFTVTAGNSSGINDGAAMVILANEDSVRRYKLSPRLRFLGMAAAGVEPRVMGLGPVPASRRLLNRLGLSLEDMDLIELNEAFAAQSLGCMIQLGLAADDPRINPLGGAIALGHPLGMSGARLVTTAYHQLLARGQGRALCTMCIGVGQGIAAVVETV